MKRHLYEVALSENELKEIIGSLCGVEVSEQVAQSIRFNTILYGLAVKSFGTRFALTTTWYR